MRVVICGGGMVGGELARKLIRDRHDVVVVDDNKEICDKLYADFGVVAVHGDVALLETLTEAQLEKADLVIAATNTDADNLSCAILAKSLGVPQIIVRVNNPAYEKAYKLAGVTALVWGTQLVVNQIIMEIEHPRARNISSIGGGRANIFSVKLPKGSPFDKKPVKEIVGDKKFPAECVFIAIFNPRNNSVTIPRGDNIVVEGDELFLIATSTVMERAIDLLTSVKKGAVKQEGS